jgi:hypothetical protein
MKHRYVGRTSCFFAIWLIATIASCSLIGGFNAKSHEQLTSLKAAHMKFLDVFTAGRERTFTAQKLTDEADRVDLRFREALEFSKSLGDDLRTRNLDLLKEIYEEDVDSVRRKGRLLTTEEASTLREPSADAYDRAIRGECARPGAPCK